MLKTSQYEEVIRFDLARSLAGRGRYWTTCYRVGSLLVDSGCAHTAPELCRSLEGTQLTHIANTHTHEDHIGADGPLQRLQPSIQILAHPLGLPILADPRRKQPLQPYRRLFWGWPQASHGCPLANGEVIEAGPYRLRALYTPGHSPDHLCLYEEGRGWLFSGDLFVGGRDRALRQGYDIWGIIASLRRVASLDIQTLFPGSARVRHDPQEELQAKLAYYEELGRQVLELHVEGIGVGEIARRLLGKPMWVELVTLGQFSRRRLVLSYLKLNGE